MAAEELASLAELRGGRVRLVAFPSAAATIAPAALKLLARDHPDVDVALLELPGAQQRELVDGQRSHGPGWDREEEACRPAALELVELAGLRGWTTYLAPAGFRDGLGVGLLTGDGRHVGYLTLLTYRPGVARAVAAGLLHAVNPLLGDAVERLHPADEAGAP